MSWRRFASGRMTLNRSKNTNTDKMNSAVISGPAAAMFWPKPWVIGSIHAPFDGYMKPRTSPGARR